jgi:hypothetical protein
MRASARVSNASQPTAIFGSSLARPYRTTYADRSDSLLNQQRVIENQTAPRLIPSLAESESSLLTGSDLPQSRQDFAQIPIRLNTGIALQAKLAINKPGDEYEQEADRVAEQVMRMPEPQLFRPGTPNTMSTFSGSQLAPAISSPRTTSPGVSGHPMHRLHRSAGNSAVSGVIQRKLQIGAPDTPEEREADRVAEQIMRMPDGAGPVAIGSSASVLHRKCAACSEEEEEIHRSATGAGPGTAPPIVNEVLSQPGQPLPKSTRDFFEPRLGADLSGVRIHTDNQAALSAEAIGARAYTMGSHIAFGSGAYAPQSQAGRSLLAHELAHTLQQSSQGRIKRGSSRTPRVGRFDNVLRRQRLFGRDFIKTGDCSVPEYADLWVKVETAKKVVDSLGGCQESDDCERNAFKIAAFAAEIAAREAMNVKCFKGGDKNHEKQVEQKKTAQEKCRDLFNDLTCSPELVTSKEVVVAGIRRLLTILMVASAAIVIVAAIMALIAAIINLVQLIIGAIAASAGGTAMTIAAATIIALLVYLRDRLGGGPPDV